MNAAVLLVTTAWLAGADQPAPPAATVVAPPAATASSCCGDCGGGCGGGCGHGFLERFRGLFHHDCGCESECKPTCAHECKPKCVQECKPKCVQECKPKCVQECKPSCEKSCCDSCRPRLFERLRGLFHHNDCCDTGCQGSCGSSCDSCRGGLFSRLRDWFHRRGCCESSCCGSSSCDGTTVVPGGTVVPAPGRGEQIAPPKDAPKKMPSPAPAKETLLNPAPTFAPAANVTIETETKSPFELNRRYVSRVDRAPDYSWLTGQLFYVHADGGLWVLRYAPLWKEDPNGGSMVLARDLRMDSYHEGDLVTVHGEIIGRHGSDFLGGPLYQVHSIKLVERSGE